MKAIPGKRYRHYKGGEYTVLALAHNEPRPDEIFVIYTMEYETPDFPKGTVWMRTLKDFEETVTINGGNVDRFSEVIKNI